MIKKLLLTAALLAPGLAYGQVSAPLDPPVVPAQSSACSGGSGPTPSADFVINFQDCHQTIDGFGANDLAVGLGNSPIPSMLYCVNSTDPGCNASGIGLSILRQAADNINGVNQPDGLFVTSQGGKMMETPWYLPDKNPSSYQPFINNVSSLIGAGVNVYAMSVANEPDCATSGPYFPPGTSSGDLSPYIDAVAPMVHSQLPGVKFIAPDVCDPSNYGAYVSGIEADATANVQTDIFDYHGYGPCNTPANSSNPTPNDHTRSVWVTESGAANGEYDPSISDALNTATNGYCALAEFDVSVWNQWWTIASGSAPYNLMIIDVDSNHNLVSVPKRYFAIGNFSRYVRPGWSRIGVSGSLSGIYGVTAFVNTSTGAFAIVAINNSGSDISNITFGLAGATVTGSVTPYVTSGTTVGALGSDGNLSAGSTSSGVPASLPITGGVFTSIVPYGVTTFVGPY
jgi:glucuronoarabinoxylan endo-1,4-beta-xylanase